MYIYSNDDYISAQRCNKVHERPYRWQRWSAAARLLGFRVRIPPGDMSTYILLVLRAVKYRSLRRADHMSRGVLPTVVCRECYLGNAEAWSLYGGVQTCTKGSL
jgi:hypothetical protein